MNNVLDRKVENNYETYRNVNYMNNSTYYNNANNYNNGYQQNNYNQQYMQNGNYNYSNNQLYNNGYVPQQSFENPMDNQEYYSQQQSYVRTSQTYTQPIAAQETKSKKKGKLNIKAKLLIGVYFFIVAVIATLLLVNMALGGATVSADGDDFLSINEDAIDFMVAEDGSLIEIEDTESLVNYDYETDSNWFDNMCDNITNKVGK